MLGRGSLVVSRQLRRIQCRQAPSTILLQSQSADLPGRARWYSSNADVGSETERPRYVKLFNSLTGTIEEVIPQNGKQLTWYSCGPTVYDHAHLGHARTYVCLDILHRVLRNGFGYNVFLVLGMTDIDDKIVKKGWELNAKSNADFLSVARGYEQSFLDDMKRLNVLPPAAIVRVSEYVDEIKAYIQGIIDQGYGYEASDGSGVYFDTLAMGPRYGKLSSHKSADAESVEDSDRIALAKRDPRDFALWKAAKANEPYWPSSWGPGRPGWHIECSAMTHSLLGPRIDMHTGGIDLKFPHHNNEIAQCEAHNHGEDWCSTFVHTGHLYIEGAKMSKSLKNFITIREFLETYTPQQFRVFCLLHKYRAPIHFSESQMQEASRVETKLKQVAERVRHCIEELHKHQPLSKKWRETERELHRAREKAELGFFYSLADDLDTPTALKAVLAFSTHLNQYCHAAFTNPGETPLELLQSCALFLVRVFSLLGLDDVAGVIHGDHSTVDNEETNRDLLDEFVSFRAEIRRLGITEKHSEAGRRALQLCDGVREKLLNEHHIAVMDLPDGTSTWERSFSTPTDQFVAESPSSKAEQPSFSLDPSELFKTEEYQGLYSNYDDKGIPTHDAQGEVLSKSARKKLVKKHERYSKGWQRSKSP